MVKESESDGEAEIGVLAIQGDVEPHLRALAAAGARGRRVRTVADLAAVDGLVIPGGESSTIGMLLERFGLLQPLRARVQGGMPAFGTCAGLILLGRDANRGRLPRLGLLDVEVRRNAYGRQVDSFETRVDAPSLGPPLVGVFIRAPRIEAVGPGVEVLGTAGDDPVLVRQGILLGAAFHPELTDDPRVHRLFLEMVRSAQRP
jgi:5'-phosphate synthase pdxT subunit